MSTIADHEGQREDRPSSRMDWLLLAIAILAFLFASWAATAFVSQPVLERHGPRQTQTAITAYWLAQNGPILAYETPVLGAPWSIPFELPLYQMVVASAHVLTGVGFDPLGRLLSFVFLLACIPQIFSLLRVLRFPQRAAYIFTALILGSPQYLFWGRSFMIETAALFLTVAATRYFICYREGEGRPRDLWLFAVMMSLALLQKITTALPVFAGLAVYWLLGQWRQRRITRATVWEMLAFVVSAGLAVAWLSYSDSVKLQNPYGELVTSSNLRAWTLGNVSERMSRELWTGTIFTRQVSRNLGGLLGIGLLGWGLATLRGRTLIGMCGCLLVYFVNLLAFSKLHIVHDYYQTSITLWLLLAAAIALSEMIAVPALRRLGVLMFVGILLSNLFWFKHTALPLMRQKLTVENNRTLALGAEIDRAIPKDAKIVVYGFNWSAEVAYYSKRRSITVEPWPRATEELISNPTRYLGETPGAVVICRDTGREKPPNVPSTDRLLALLGSDNYDVKPVMDCEVLFARTSVGDQ